MKLVVIGGEMEIIARLFIFCQIKKLSTPPPICQKVCVNKSINNNQSPYNREVVNE